MLSEHGERAYSRFGSAALHCFTTAPYYSKKGESSVFVTLMCDGYASFFFAASLRVGERRGPSHWWCPSQSEDSMDQGPATIEVPGGVEWFDTSGSED